MRRIVSSYYQGPIEERTADIELARRLTEPLPASSHDKAISGPVLADRRGRSLG